METLADRIAREGPLNELDAVGWAIRLAKRIEGMHALGVTHGSMSPSCVLIEGTDRSARAQLMDVRRSPTTLACQSPERLHGGGLSQPDDTWALACTLYATLTGSPAFSGADDAELRQKILASSPAPLAVFDVGDDDLQRILDDAFARDMDRRTTSVAALRAALEEWHPDPNVGALPAVEEEDPDGAADDEDQRTIMRPSSTTATQIHMPIGLSPPHAPSPSAARPLPAAGARPLPAAGARPLPAAGARVVPLPRASQPGLPPPAAPPPSLGEAPPADDDEEDERTVMRTAPEHMASAVMGGAARSGAFAAASAGKSGAFPAGAPLPGVADDLDDDEATRMLPTPALLDPDDDDEQATLMRSSLTPDEAASRMAAARPLPAAGARAPSAESPSSVAAFPSPAAAPASRAEPSPPAAEPPAVAGAAVAAPLPAPAVAGAAPVTPPGGPAPVAAPNPRRTAVWLVLVALVVAAVVTFAVLGLR